MFNIHKDKTKMGSLNVFSNAINKVRDILRGPGMSITGMDSMRHICIYLLARYITFDKIKELEIPEELAWENIMDLLKPNGGAEKALELFYHPDVEQSLINHFDRLFETNNFTFEVKSPLKHKDILETINKINLNEIDCKIDILGWVYELHLKTGSAAARDLGQFFTDRDICNYMVNICQPKFKDNGLVESVCDPTMGTAGFLTSYIRFFNTSSDSINWKENEKQINGCDSDSKVAGVARLNFFMETKGVCAKNLLTHDSLYNDLPQEKYDIILANMPFGIKGIKYEECCQRIKSLKIKGTKSEPLFLQLMGLSLEKGGRCAVVVPDGMLNNISTLHNNTRKYVVDNFELKYVIKMNGSFFMNTSIQTSILYFENNGYSTGGTTFLEVVKNDKGEIEQKVLHTIARTDFDINYSFDIKRYKKEEVVNTSVEYSMIKLSEIVSIQIGGTPLRSNTSYYENGTNIWVSVSELNSNVIYDSKEKITDEGVKHSNVKLASKGSVLMSFKLSIGKCGIAGVDLYTNEAIAALNSLNENIVINKYIYYYILFNDFSEYAKGSIGTGSLNKETLSNIEIPLPPIEIQNKIVQNLDKILGNKSKEMAKNIREQMKALMKSVEHKKFDKKKLSEICNHSNGKTLSSEEKEKGGEYPVMGGGIDYIGSYDKYNREGVNITISKSGASSGFVKLHNTKFWAGDCFTIAPQNESLSTMYLYNIMWSYQDKIFELISSSSVIPHCKWDDIKDIEIPLPPIEIQNKIVEKLEKLEAKAKLMKELANESEENAKFILDSYLGH
jgi:restriction endonuclease S subunit